jgi:hypothetical protein
MLTDFAWPLQPSGPLVQRLAWVLQRSRETVQPFGV